MEGEQGSEGGCRDAGGLRRSAAYRRSWLDSGSVPARRGGGTERPGWGTAIVDAFTSRTCRAALSVKDVIQERGPQPSAN